MYERFSQLSVAAVQSHGLQTPILPKRNFHGCLENLLYNDLNLIKLAKQNSPQVTAVLYHGRKRRCWKIYMSVISNLFFLRI
ncbi:hypothetical protein ATANTOWER_030187 [Ataeniobius toweri]|uniref:Uncharacterized protein n=1 Tax=Ataeniobius toweri TaxID=208326 RepID=A0ABU7AA22_9TELE|nr:hypothetical protein [Ataeniobius toweri]